ncbi:MAG: RsmB/NOP family class I SAM-dependent RNA methyltransferase [Sphingomonadales bacterium]|jgi:16S rRNA (cytosine967-C5)-methyltransferase
MTPAARLQCAIEALDEIEESIARQGAAADVLLKAFFRARRYAGSGDRRAVFDHVYAVLRARGLYLWICGEAGQGSDGRRLLISHLALNDASLLDLFTGETYAPAKIADSERQLIALAQTIDQETAPLWAKWNCPAYLADSLQRRFGEGADAVRLSLNERAPVDLRVNSLSLPREDLKTRFAEESIELDVCAHSPWGLRLKEQRYLENHPLFRSGYFELQDEGSQIVSALCEAQPGQTVIDLCAGAGGKTLALAAMMKDRGRLLAADTSLQRLKNLDPRLKRSAVTCVSTHLLNHDLKSRADVFKDVQGKADLVVVDAPCSGTGTWRRHPEARWRYDRDDIKKFTKLQDDLIDEACMLVKPGGRVVYITCSLLEEEGEHRVEAALKRNGDLKLMDYHGILPNINMVALAETHSYLEQCLLLSPYRHGVDGFFFATFERLNA